MKPEVAKRFVLLMLVIFVGLGAILRFQAVTQTVVVEPVRGDAVKYISYAWNLRYYGIYTFSTAAAEGRPAELKPDALITPGYPLFLSLFFRAKQLSLSSYSNILLTQAALSTLTVLLTYGVFRVVGRLIGLVVTLLTALSPHLINMTVYLLTETLFCFWLMAFFAVLAMNDVRKKPLLLLVAGSLLGAATLTRPWTQGFALIVFLFLTLGSHVPWRRALLFLLGFTILVAPWVGRNLTNLGVASDSTLSVTSVYHGSFPHMMLDNRPETFGVPYEFDPQASELLSSPRALRQVLWQRFKKAPWEYLHWFTIGKVITVFSWNIVTGMGDVFVYPVEKTPFTTAPHFRFLHNLMKLLHGPLTALALVTCCLVWVSERRVTLRGHVLWLARCISMFFGYFIFLHLIGTPEPRYSIPLRPLLYGMALMGVVILWGWIPQRAFRCISRVE